MIRDGIGAALIAAVVYFSPWIIAAMGAWI
jgi:hypothetical protein